MAENPVLGTRALLSREALDVLALCDGARGRQAIAAALPWSEASPAARRLLLDATLDRLAAARLLATDDVPTRDPYARGYTRPWLHRALLTDRVRTRAFQRALEAVVRPGDVVLDVGAGTGILSFFAARAGAAAVHAVEQTPLARAARAAAERNGLGEVVTVHEGDAAELELGVRVDVLVSEWLGQMALLEGVFPAVAAARDRHLRPGGAVIPAEVELFLAPLVEGALAEGDPAFWLGRPWGLDLGPFFDEEVARLASFGARVPPGALLAPSERVWRLDCRTAGATDLVLRRAVSFRAARDGTLAGVAGWFRARLAPGVVLDTAPDAPETHWLQYVFPAPPLPLARGQRLDVTFEAQEAPGAPRVPRFLLELATAGETRRYRYRPS